MELLWALLLAFGSLLFGLACGLFIGFWRVRDTKSVFATMLHQQKQESESQYGRLKESFEVLSADVLKRTNEDFFKLAQERLGAQTKQSEQDLSQKKQLIDQTLQTMKAELGKVSTMVTDLEKDRHAKFSTLSQQLGTSAKETQKLQATTNSLQQALSNSRIRGQWGDRMAEDVLRLSGFVEGINYKKQQSHTDTSGKRFQPDYTFYLPQDRLVHMDVKFPLDNYIAYLNASSEQKQPLLKQFLNDARARIKEAATRTYAGADTGQDALSYVLVFIPNEQVYAFLHEHDQTLLDDALRQKVILCSPMTLYAILAVIRQAMDHFQLEQRAGEIYQYLEQFKSQWQTFCDALEKVNKKLDESQRAFSDVLGTRKRQLERPLNKMLELEPPKTQGAELLELKTAS